MTNNDRFITKFKGSFVSMMRWPQVDTLWEKVHAMADDGWYVYAIGESPPDKPLNKVQMITFLTEIDALLRKEHKEDYCGIVYADNPESPSFIKIYDPNNLGVVCGFSDNPPLPGWTLSKIPPCDLEHALPPPGNRQRWWKRLFQSQ